MPKVLNIRWWGARIINSLIFSFGTHTDLFVGVILHDKILHEWLMLSLLLHRPPPWSWWNCNSISQFVFQLNCQDFLFFLKIHMETMIFTQVKDKNRNFLSHIDFLSYKFTWTIWRSHTRNEMKKIKEGKRRDVDPQRVIKYSFSVQRVSDDQLEISGPKNVKETPTPVSTRERASIPRMCEHLWNSWRLLSAQPAWATATTTTTSLGNKKKFSPKISSTRGTIDKERTGRKEGRTTKKIRAPRVFIYHQVSAKSCLLRLFFFISGGGEPYGEEYWMSILFFFFFFTLCLQNFRLMYF